MITAISKRLRRFGKDESGAAMLIEFCVFVPLIFTAFFMAFEMGFYSQRQMYLDRGLDVAVRYIRLGTGTSFDHDEIKDVICANAGFLEDCDSSLRLEMQRVNPRSFTTLPNNADCIDTAEPIEPARGFSLGVSHDIMLLRACVKFDPVFPTTGLGNEFQTDGAGKVKMLSVAAFVQEPS